MQNETKPLCGIDEAGRGPLAGALVMAGVVLKKPIDGLMDSKKLTEKRREALYTIVLENAEYHIVSFSAKEVDDLGISKCLQKGLQSIQNALDGCKYLFDGNSTFGVDNVSTMVKADDKVPEVSAASILAKVTRDREMIKMAEIYPEYGFEKHKGYGTKAHIEALMKYDRCEIHRRSFRVKGLDEPTLF
ncbi:ribonuclease HII [Sulfurovum sp. NBC37-1]|uniref:Ribonuclease HII n=1 Tax=Sulfurovum sp. (strain NBC37-1) TaxID=387093 RepID=RNH2_SULNB|nr:ribonuclease HII [Sulfurovum sp. NBC37-1]A6QCJ3.1 RecName: Full=Ribonuclease HII; Short=RNase HII [Sulfurovum sp. NBC37-1]BAF73202.1 ribonuclease HII [Sulfurovum sp. NBC37-1]